MSTQLLPQGVKPLLQPHAPPWQVELAPHGDVLAW
jgi:hypothetical protein